MNVNTLIQSEFRRLQYGPSVKETPKGSGIVRFFARCPLGAKNTLENVISVLSVVDEFSLQDTTNFHELAAALPGWFIASCAPSMSPEESLQWLNWWKELAPEDQAKAELEKDWSLTDWLYWMKPENRQWFWWEAKALDDVDHIALAVEVLCWPFPWGALRWLFKASGASALEPEE